MSIAPVQCPYIPEHKMHIDSFITHLNRCKAPNKHLFVNCYYNSLHVILKEKYDEHLINCEDRIRFMDEQKVDREEEDEWNQEYYYDRSSTRSGSHLSYSNQQDYYDYGYYEEDRYGRSYSHTRPQQNYCTNSFFYSQPQQETRYPSKKAQVQSNGLDFTFRKDNYPCEAKARVENGKKKEGMKHDSSLIETCESSFSIKNRSNGEVVRYDENDDDEVLELIEAIDLKLKSI